MQIEGLRARSERDRRAVGARSGIIIRANVLQCASNVEGFRLRTTRYAVLCDLLKRAWCRRHDIRKLVTIWCCACHSYCKRISNDTVAAPRDLAIGSRPVESAIGSQAIERDLGRPTRNPARSGLRSGRDRETRDRRQDLGCDRTQTLRYAVHAKRCTLLPRDIHLAMRNTNLDHKLVVVLIVQTHYTYRG